MLLFDTTKTGRRGHRSGLTRVSERLRSALEGEGLRAVSWDSWDRSALRPGDWFFTSELFSEAERPGIRDFLARPPCRTAALFHDAIPLRLPSITWPQSVARHPEYMKLLARFHRIWAVSQASRAELLAFWRWQGVPQPPPVEVLPLGADFDATPRVLAPAAPSSPPVLLCVGILEPRKNQSLLLDACPALWDSGLRFELHFAGRVNPHFGAPIAKRLRALRKVYPFLHFHEGASDNLLGALLSRARATLFPTIAEGCGLPLLESLWRGVPCLCSDLPVLLENASAGGCLPVCTGDIASWQDALRSLLTDPRLHASLCQEARSRPLPSWSDAAQQLAASLGD